MPAGGKPYGPKMGRKKSDAGANAYDTGMKGTGMTRRAAPVAKKVAPAKRGSRRMG